MRATMLLRANAFASNYSGPQVAVIDRLLDFLNAGLHPVMPAKGSVGASGDLAPLAYLAGAPSRAFDAGRSLLPRAAACRRATALPRAGLAPGLRRSAPRMPRR